MRIVSALTLVAVSLASHVGSTPHDTITPVVKTHAAPSWAPFGTKACAEEDSDGPCFWDAGSVGNRRGTSFYVIPLSKHRKSYTYPFKPSLNEVTARDYD